MAFDISGNQIWFVLFSGLTWCIALFLYLWGSRKRQADERRFGQMTGLLFSFSKDIWKTERDADLARSSHSEHRTRLIRKALRRRRSVKSFLVLLSLLCLVIASARPQWGTRQENIYQRGIDLVIVLDTSKSMKAQDIAPSRLEKAKSEIAALLNKLEGNRVALVGFASTTRLHCPLSLDFRGLRSIMDHSISFGIGTDIEAAIDEALRVLKHSEARVKTILIVSDGEDHTGDIDKAIRKVQAAGVSIFCLGIGTPDGGPIPVGENDSSSYMKKNGELVWTRLQEDTLKRLASATGGRYFRSTALEQEVDRLANIITGLEKTTFSQTVTTRKEERFSFFLLLAVCLLAIEEAMGDFNRISWDEDHEQT